MKLLSENEENKSIMAMKILDDYFNDNYSKFSVVFTECVVNKDDFHTLDYEKTLEMTEKCLSKHETRSIDTYIMNNWINMIWYSMDYLNDIWFLTRSFKIERIIVVLIVALKRMMIGKYGKTPKMESLPASLVNVYDKLHQLKEGEFKKIQEETLRKVNKHKDIFRHYCSENKK